MFSSKSKEDREKELDVLEEQSQAQLEKEKAVADYIKEKYQQFIEAVSPSKKEESMPDFCLLFLK